MTENNHPWARYHAQEARRDAVQTEGILLPGWDCQVCGMFTGTAKFDLKECRCCGAPRQIKLYRIRQTRWCVKYVEIGYTDDEPVPDELPLEDAVSEAKYFQEQYATHHFEVVPASALLVQDIPAEYKEMLATLTRVQTRCTGLLLENRELRALLKKWHAKGEVDPLIFDVLAETEALLKKLGVLG
jgi:hypothetical protein